MKSEFVEKRVSIEVTCTTHFEFPAHGARGGKGDDGNEEQKAVFWAQPWIEKSLSCDQSSLLGTTTTKYTLFCSRYSRVF